MLIKLTLKAFSVYCEAKHSIPKEVGREVDLFRGGPIKE